MVFQENTSVQGTVPISTITEYVNTAGNTEFETPHTITVSKPLYTTSITIYNVSVSQNIYHFVLLEIDSIPPMIIIHSPENTTYTQNVILLNLTVIDDNLDTSLYNWNGTDVPYTNLINITYNSDFITLNVWANDSLGNFNSTNVSFTILLPDLIVSDIFFEPGLYVEGQTRYVFVNVSNIASGDALDFSVFLNISYWNGSKTNIDEVFFNNLNMLAGQSQILNTTWTLDIGKYIFEAEADYHDAIIELNKLNNFLERNKTISAWQVLYGNFDNVVLNLENSGSNLFKEWNVSTPSGLLYFADIDAVFEPYNLRPINESGWLALVDAALNLTGFDDSVSALFDTTNNGLPDNFTSATIAGTSMDVPIIYSANETTSFYTGLLYDAGSLNEAYDGSQAIVFVTFVDGPQVGAYGSYDYELRVPVTLRDQFGAVSQLQRIIEIN